MSERRGRAVLPLMTRESGGVALAFAALAVALTQTGAARRAWPRPCPGATRPPEFC